MLLRAVGEGDAPDRPSSATVSVLCSSLCVEHVIDRPGPTVPGVTEVQPSKGLGSVWPKFRRNDCARQDSRSTHWPTHSPVGTDCPCSRATATFGTAQALARSHHLNRRRRFGMGCRHVAASWRSSWCRRCRWSAWCTACRLMPRACPIWAQVAPSRRAAQVSKSRTSARASWACRTSCRASRGRWGPRRVRARLSTTQRVRSRACVPSSVLTSTDIGSVHGQ